MDAEKERPRAIWTNVRLHVVSDVDDYRALATRLAGDAAGCVIELGGATGETTALLAERARRVVVVEKGRQRAQMLWRRFSGRENVVVVHADANDLDVVRATLSRAQCLFVDLGGDAPAWTTMAVVERYVRAFRPAAVVVRNTAVAQFLAATAAEPEGTSALASAPSGLSSTHKPEVRRAARMLAAAATPEAASHLASLLVDADARTRRAASQGLLALGAMSLSPLAAILEDRGADVRARRTAAALIVRIGTLAIADLVGLMRSASPAAEWAAATALVRGGAPDAALKLLPSCPAARLAACHESNRMSAVADVVALLADGDEVVAWAL
ncbi:MAG: rRNA adenine N-6-methyltransferase family protein, partial [Armatimonadota bacterium]